MEAQYKNIIEASSLVPNISDEFRDELLKRSHYIHRFENGTINEIVGHYNHAKTEIANKLQRLVDTGQGYTINWRIQRLQGQLNEIDFVLKNATDNAVKELSYNLNEFSIIEKDYYESLLATKFGQIGVNITRIPFEHVSEIVAQPLGGATYAERMVKNYSDSIFAMKNQLIQSVIQGEDIAKASRRLIGVGTAFGGKIGQRIVHQSTVIARTEIMRISNSVNRAVFDGNQDIIKGLEYLATLDDRTCIACGVLDGKIFYYKKNPPGAGEIPPIHPLCRCTFVPITYTWKELGVNKDEIPPGQRPYIYKQNLQKFAGQVTSTMRYRDWLKMMDAKDSAFVRDILGPRRYDLWKAGKVDFARMATSNRILTLEELRKLKSFTLRSGEGERPMSSVKGFLNCIIGTANEFFLESAKPSPCTDYVRDDNGKWFLKGDEVFGKELERLNKMGIPPAWKNVVAAVDLDAKVQAIGIDNAGRWQYRYSAKHIEKAARKKFDRVRLFSNDMPVIRAEIEKGISKGDSRAFLLDLEDKTAIRVGSAKDFKAKKKAYGLTTLRNEHVSVFGNRIVLDFTAKEGIPAHYELTDKRLASWLKIKKSATKKGEQLFPDVSASSVNSYLKEISGGKNYTVKDFRTYHGTRIAYRELKTYGGEVLSSKRKKDVIKGVLGKVSGFLKNTSAMAKNSYINPMVWDFIGGL